jgi:glutathione S-transferase
MHCRSVLGIIYDITSAGEQRVPDHHGVPCLARRPWLQAQLTKNEVWGEHCRKEALAHAALIDKHLADGRHWLLGGGEPTFEDVTLAAAIAFSKYPVNATPLDERFEFMDAYWQRWQQRRPGFQATYADRQSGIAALDHKD